MTLKSDLFVVIAGAILSYFTAKKALQPVALGVAQTHANTERIEKHMQGRFDGVEWSEDVCRNTSESILREVSEIKKMLAEKPALNAKPAPNAKAAPKVKAQTNPET